MVNQFFPFLFPDDDSPGFGRPNFPGQGGPGFGNPNSPGQGRPPGFPGQGRQPDPPRQGGSSAPTGPPPSFVPQQSTARGGVGVFAVDPGAIRGCLFRFTYVWLRNGRAFWFFPTFVGRESVAGFRWNGFRWNYYGTDLDRISSFQCF